MIVVEKERVFSNFAYRNTLMEISKDNSNVRYMTHSSKTAVNFDKLKEMYRSRCGAASAPICSVDAVLTEPNLLAMVEFKNGILMKQGKAVPKLKENIKAKIRDSLLIFCDLCGQSIADTRKQLHFILVYNESKNISSLEKIKQKIKKEELFSALDLRGFEKIYFRSVKLFTEEEFEDFLKRYNLY